MLHKKWRFRIDDMIEAIERIVTYTKNLSLIEFSKDQKTIDATIRCFEILGEAARHIPTKIQGKYQKFHGQKSGGCATY